MSNPKAGPAVIGVMPPRADPAAPALDCLSLSIAGIDLRVFNLSALPKSGDIAVAFFLHGRTNKKEDLLSATEHLIKAQQQAKSSESLPLVVGPMSLHSQFSAHLQIDRYIRSTQSWWPYRGPSKKPRLARKQSSSRVWRDRKPEPSA